MAALLVKISANSCEKKSSWPANHVPPRSWAHIPRFSTWLELFTRVWRNSRNKWIKTWDDARLARGSETSRAKAITRQHGRRVRYLSHLNARLGALETGRKLTGIRKVWARACYATNNNRLLYAWTERFTWPRKKQRPKTSRLFALSPLRGNSLTFSQRKLRIIFSDGRELPLGMFIFRSVPLPLGANKNLENVA